MAIRRAAFPRFRAAPRRPRSRFDPAVGATWLLLVPLGPVSVSNGATLPIPCAASSCAGVSGPQTWVTSGSARLVQVGNVMTITQGSANAVLNWQSFNISSDGTVTFNQPNASSVALNQIFQADPSKILGALNANGSIYLINQNGIVFGSGAQVNTGTLIASSLNITPNALTGILNAATNGGAAFTSPLDANGNSLSGAVQVAPGAKISAPGGEIMLFGSSVINQGSLRADGGQVILAAGDSVYLAASSDPNLRGLLVEVGHGGTVTNAAASTPGGTDAGQIASNDGNVTLVGLIVNQLGRISATTAVQQNGSIYLKAEDGGTVSTAGGIVSLAATHGGTLTLGSGSQTDVTLDTASQAEAVDATAQPQSKVVLTGQSVTLVGGSEITATHGNVAITAAAIPGQDPETLLPDPGTGRLVIDNNASIDVSGANIALPVSDNVIAVQLRGVELADSPLQRNGPLQGQTVYVDARQSGVRANGTTWVGSPIGDLSGYVAAVQRNVAERSLTGGTIALNSDGAVFVSPQAKLTISGGSIDYLPGYVNTSKLMGANGTVYDISQANPNQIYTGIVSNYSVTDPKWGVTQTYPTIGTADPRGQYEVGYLEGKDAGSLTIAAPRMVLDANVTANTVIGPFQRQMPSPPPDPTNPPLYRPINQMPLSGQLILGIADGGGAGGDNYLLPDVVFASCGVLSSLSGPTGAPFNPLTDPLPAALDTVHIRPDLIGPGGIGQLDLYSNGHVSIPADVALQFPSDGQLVIKAGEIDVAGSITAHSGGVSLAAVATQTLVPGSPGVDMTLGPQALIDVSGQWINDQPAPTAPTGTAPLDIAGGKVSISASADIPLDLQAGSLIDASGGAQRTVGRSFVGGTGGSIALSVGTTINGGAVPTRIETTLEDFGLQQGGSLSLTANSLCVSNADCTGGQAGAVWVPTSLFSADGFANIALKSNLGGIDVAPGTQITAQQLNFILNGDPAAVPSGVPFSSLAAPGLLQNLQRAPENLSFSVSPAAPQNLPFDNTTYATAGVLNIEKNSAILLDPKASLSLSSDSSILIDGQLSAPAGSISIATTTKLPIATFIPSQGIWLENDARVSTAGTALLQINDLEQPVGSVLNGGAISIAANRGYIITEPGSSLDASGTAAQVAVTSNTAVNGLLGSSTQLIGSNGGTVSLAAAEGMLLNGVISAPAGRAPGTAGGALDITLDGNLHGGEPSGVGGQAIFPFSPRQIVVTAGAPVVVAPQYAVPDQFNGMALVPSALIESGGFSALQMTARNLFDTAASQGTPVSTASIVFAQDTTLELPSSIRLDTPQISAPGVQVVLQAAYVGLGSSDNTSGAQVGSSISAGTGPSNAGSLTVRADLVDFVGTLGLGGILNTKIESSGDVRFSGIESLAGTPQPIAGQLLAAGNLDFQATQLYPTTLSQFEMSVSGAPDNAVNTLSIESNGSAAGAVLSAGGRLTLEADTIDQAGVVRAPFGQITLGAAPVNGSFSPNSQVTLAAGSITSTSGAGQLIPFGSTQAGTDWVYSLPDGNSQVAVYTQSGPPAKSVQINGNSVVVAKGATVDISGGGDLQASEFVPGVGGTLDVLSNGNGASPGQFAIVPQLSLQYAPIDPQSQVGFPYAPGSSVTLSGGGGVAAGTYAILPASYALLPGAYLVRPVSGFTDIAAGKTLGQLDGSTIVSGRFAVAGTSIESSRTQGFDIRPGSAVQNLAQYTLTSADSFFSKLAQTSGVAPPPLPQDAGQLQFSAGQELEFLGKLVSLAAPNGRGAEVDISAAQIEVTNASSAAPAPGSVLLEASQLNALGAQSLLIGGTRSLGATATDIATTASSVTVDSGVTLSGSEILLAATNNLTLAAGATVSATGAPAAVPSEYDLTGGGALVRVSSGPQTTVVRSSLDGALGSLTIGAGVTLEANGSATLEASGNFQSQASYELPGGSLSFGASQISVGAAPANTPGLVLSAAELSSLKLSDLTLATGSSLDVFGANVLAVDGSLTIDTPSIVAADNLAALALQAKQLTLLGSASGATGSVPVASSGGLTLQADHLILSGGPMQFSGFATTALNGAAEIRASAGGSIMTDSPLTLATGLLSTATGVSFQFTSAQTLNLVGPLAASQSAPSAPGAGGQISLTGSNVTVDSAVTLPSGQLLVSATGSGATDNITLGSGAAINVAGITTNFDSLIVAGPGGSVQLDAAAGNVVMNSGAQINLSAPTGSATAGSLTISAVQGTADLQGTLTATGGTGAGAGQFSLDAASLPDLAALNGGLNAGGFSGQRSFRQRGQGDVVLASSGDIRASNVSISNDGGSVDVLGLIDASGISGGSVSLAAANAVDISGVINASASGAGQSGGTLEITSTSGLVHIENAATVNLAGGAGASGGNLNLTVPRSSLTGLLGSGNPPSIALGGGIQGVQQVQVEGLASYNAANDATPNVISAADTVLWNSDATTFMGNAAAISAALNQSNPALNVSVVPGIQIYSQANSALGLNGDLALSTSWDLSSWRFGAANVPGILTLRAAGNLLINASLSDGFNGVTGSDAFVLPGAADRSWSYRLIAGADLNASNLMAVEPAGALAIGGGNIEMAAGTPDTQFHMIPSEVMVRTGTGNIDLAAAGDLKFGNRASVIYTAGQDSGQGIPLLELANLAYPTAGGNISINVGGDIVGAPTNQLVTSWLWRAGQAPGGSSAASATGWTANYQYFEENVGALAGGNVSINAGGNISDLSVAIPTIGRQVGGAGFAQSALQVTGGGQLTVQSGGNISGGSYFVGQGGATINAGGAIGSDTALTATAGPAPILALGDAQLEVTARGGLTIESALNPFLLPQARVQPIGLTKASLFSTYSGSSAVMLVSSGGDVTLLDQPGADGLDTVLSSMSLGPGRDLAFTAYPGTLNAIALNGNVNVGGPATLWPSSTGNLNLLAQQNVVFVNGGQIVMSGLDPASLPNPAAPIKQVGMSSTQTLLALPGVASAPIHLGDPNPARVVALDGNVSDAVLAYIPKPIHVIAGQDISELTLQADNLVSTDLSIVSAGRDISYASPRDANGVLTPNTESIVIEGPGSLLVEAGRNVNLGVSEGITTEGNLNNPALPTGGASVSVLTGAAIGNADIADFTTTYLVKSTAYDSLLASFVEAQTGVPVANKAQALAAFNQLSRAQQFELCEQIFYDEIRTGGRAAAAPGPQHNDYSQSFAALTSLFPNSATPTGPHSAVATYPGSLSLFFSRIYTLDGGDISLLTPGGSVNVGLAAPPTAFGIIKDPSELGIVAQGTGNINSVSYGDFLVNQSRVFAAGGGNILVWSTDGNVDAGRGAKTAISAPAPTVTIDPATGRVTTTFPQALVGSGIQALATAPGEVPGNVDLYAPQGVVNASDAGIVAGNLTIGATAVLGRNNITVSGVSVGVPVDASGLGASLAGSSSVSSSASNAATVAADVGSKAQSAAPLAETALGFLDVFVLGLGEDTCQPDDIECLKRQKSQ